MRILHIASSYLPAYEHGGPILSVHNLNKWLAKKREEITVYTAKRQKNKKEEKRIIDGVEVHYFPFSGYIHFTFSLKMFFALKKNIKDFDLVHITGVWNFPVWAAAFWARRCGIPYIISPRGSLMKEPLEKKSSLKKKIHLILAGKKILKEADLVHFTAGKEREEYEKTGLPMRKAIVIPNGIESKQMANSEWQMAGKFKKKYGIAEESKIVLSLGRLNWKKGFDTLIPAFKLLVTSYQLPVTPCLVIAGPDEGGYKNKILELIANSKLQVGKDIIFTGQLLDEAKEAAFRATDVFVLPSYSENFGMAVVEAMGYGLPVIITEGVGISPEIKEAGAGIVINKDEKELAEAIAYILNNPKEADKMGKSGQGLVRKEFSAEKVVEKWIGVCGEMANG